MPVSLGLNAGSNLVEGCWRGPALSHISECAERWKAVLLLDEADVYLSQQSHDRLYNSLVLVFLRKLEYYEGIMFLTTNRLKDFDEAILSRLLYTLL
jgi:SpoVK/Ycf46/Vps4 family AAA+-type ATPase